MNTDITNLYSNLGVKILDDVKVMLEITSELPLKSKRLAWMISNTFG